MKLKINEQLMRNEKRKIVDVGEARKKERMGDPMEWQPELTFKGREADVHPGRL